MPCSDYGEAEARADALGLMRDDERHKIERAGLCGVMRAIEADPSLGPLLARAIDWARAGIAPNDLTRWYDDHRKRDALHEPARLINHVDCLKPHILDGVRRSHPK